MSGQQLYPRPERKKKDKSGRPFCVVYDLAYDGGGSKWYGYYRTRPSAHVAAWWNVHFASWGGSAVLYKQ